jgi:hypothetical protein
MGRPEPFSFFEKEFPELVAIDSKGISVNKVNFFEQEREEMRALTEASEISHNVWVRSRSVWSVIANEEEKVMEEKKLIKLYLLCRP